MIEINHSCRTFLHKNGQVMIRVRWNNRKDEIGFSVGCNADPDKWDNENQRARYNTTHKVGRKIYVARDINNRISQFLECIEESFTEYGLNSQLPTRSELKELVNEKLGRIKEEIPVEVEEVQEKTLKNAFFEFMKLRPSENNWGEKTHFKYNQMWDHLNSFDSAISLETLDKKKLNGLKDWYIANDYHNATINKHFRNLKGILKWADSNGYSVKKEVFTYKTNLPVPPKTVTFLKYKELIHFASFQFPVNKEYLDRARDYFCFMAFTSLRYSDLKALKKANVSGEYIDLYTQKTKDKIRIPIISHARKILEKYKDNEGVYVFSVPSNQKLNDYIKEAAELAGLDREVVETYFIGTQRYEEIHKFYETISCHDGRRTFVCCSLALGITSSVVMSCTGHADYSSMRPYIEVADETQKLQMDKWNTYQYKSDIIERIDKMNPTQLKELCEYIRNIA
ncbi:site-specific integrase [Bacteroides sp.]|uniref:site-specific integrase n=1 Tax=Bacteroides sp. TaxID=29523 RepID=UPI0025BEB68E|nr:site-specific integrase [Bacteroides sp.]